MERVVSRRIKGDWPREGWMRLDALSGRWASPAEATLTE